MASDDSIAAFTVNWNNFEDTIVCISSILSCEEKIDVFVVDNASTDGSVSAISSAFPDINIIQSDENLGFSGGANIAIKEILSKGYERILSINNDATLSRGVVSELSRALDDDPSIGILSPWIVYPDSNKIWFAGGVYFSWLGMTMHEKKGTTLRQNRADKPVETGYVCGCCALYSSEFLIEVGLFNENLFMYGEDLEHSLSAVRYGWRVCTLPSAVIEHKASSSTGSEQNKHFSKFRAYYYARNPILILYRSPNSLRKLTALFSQLAIALPYSLTRMFLEGSLNSLPNYLRGLVHGFRGKGGPVVLMNSNLQIN